MLLWNRSSSWLTHSALLLAAAWCASALTAQEQPVPLTFNASYHCNDGTTMIVSHCETKGNKEYCFFRIEQSGQLSYEAYSVRGQMAGRVKACSLQGGSQPVPAGSHAVQDSSSSARAGNAQGLNPPYLSEMPSVDRVMRAMQASDPRETALRQMGAFYQLMEIIKTLSGHREFRGFTPDESRILQDYATAQYKVGQAADAAFPGPYGKEKQFSLNTPYRYSRNDPKFGVEGIPVFQTFFTPKLRAQFEHIIGGENARHDARVAEDRQLAARALAATSQAAAQPGQSQFVRNDPGTLAARRCLESGRSEMECIGQGLKTGFNDLMGNAMGGVAPGFGQSSAPTGLRMSGHFTGEGFSIVFNDESASVQCGKLVPQDLAYTVERAANQILVKVPITPKPLTVTLRPDGKLAGPGPVAVAGRVVVGTSGGGGSSAPGYEMQTHTTTQERQIAAADIPNYNSDAVHQNGMEYSVSEQATSTTYEPTAPQPHDAAVITAPKTEHCSAGVLPGTATAGISAALTQIFDSSSAKKTPPQPVGLRMYGTYAGQGGLSIEFRGDLATVECGEAHVAEPYAVEDASGRIVVKIQNGATPFTVLLQPDGTLAGSGTVDVVGRVVTGSRGDEILYAPRKARCAIGTLMPKGGTPNAHASR